MNMKRLALIGFSVVSIGLWGQTTLTSGNWSDASIWSGGAVPINTSGTSGSPVSIGDATIIDQNISITSGVYHFGYNGTAVTSTNSTDVPGGTLSTLTVQNGAYSATAGTLNIRSGTTTFEGAGLFDNANITISSTATLILGSLTIQNKCVISILGTLIINGNMINDNNGMGSSFNVGTGGLVIVNGNYSAPVGNVTFSGGGDLFTTGSLSSTGSSTTFGSKGDCPTGPCSGRNLCEISNGVTIQNLVAADQTLCSGVTPATLTSTTSAGVIAYQWQTAVSLDAFGGIGTASDITGATTATYSPAAASPAAGVVTTAYYRLYIQVPSSVDPSGFCTSYAYPIVIKTFGNGGWISDTNTGNATRDDWNVAANWCGSIVPISSTIVNINSFPTGSGRLMPIIKSADADVSRLIIGIGASASGVSSASLTLNGGFTLNIHGTQTNSTNHSFNNNGTFTSAATGTVAFVGTSNSNTNPQTIGGTSFNTFGNLTFNSTGNPTTGPHYTIRNNNMTVVGTLTLSGGKLNLNGLTLQLGTGATAATKGTLVHTDGVGWMYGGNFQRYFDNTSTITVGASAGRFPMGIFSDYRPFSVGNSAALSTGGWIKLSHTGFVYGYVDNPIADTDAASILRRSTSLWKSTINGVASAGSTVSIEAGGTSFSFNATLAHFRLRLASAIIGSPSVGGPTGSAANPRIQRIGMTAANLANDFYVGSTDYATPLPITLSDFNASLTKEGVDVSWATLTEENADFFQIEKSTNGYDFGAIGTKDAQGSSVDRIDYFFLDKNTNFTKAYYRLKNVDVGGAFTYSNIVSVERQGFNNSGVLVYPNPVENRVVNVLVGDGSSVSGIISLWDLSGKAISNEQKANVQGEYKISDEIKTGFYLLKVQTKNIRQSVKVVIQD